MPDVGLTRWDSLRDLLALNEQMGQWVGADGPGWLPAVDLYETATEYVLTAELPGLSRDQIEIEAEEARITIRGERAAVQRTFEQYHRVERGHGRFSRAFELPDLVDVEAVTADLRDGVLTVTIPKASDRGTRVIRVT